jgi:hypothetical protein
VPWVVVTELDRLKTTARFDQPHSQVVSSCMHRARPAAKGPRSFPSSRDFSVVVGVQDFSHSVLVPADVGVHMCPSLPCATSHSRTPGLSVPDSMACPSLQEKRWKLRGWGSSPGSCPLSPRITEQASSPIRARPATRRVPAAPPPRQPKRRPGMHIYAWPKLRSRNGHAFPDVLTKYEPGNGVCFHLRRQDGASKHHFADQRRRAVRQGARVRRACGHLGLSSASSRQRSSSRGICE